MVIPWSGQRCWGPGGLSIKARGGERPSVVASWMGSSVLDEALSPSDRGERSETFSLGGGGYPRGIAKGCPLKTPKQPAKLRRVAFLGGAAPYGHNIFSANRSKMLLSPPKGKGGRRHTPCRPFVGHVPASYSEEY